MEAESGFGFRVPSSPPVVLSPKYVHVSLAKNKL